MSTINFGSSDRKSVLMFIRDGSRDLHLMLEEEVMVMKTMLEAEGYHVETATVDGKDISDGHLTVKIDHKISDISMDDYVAIILPCMAPPKGSKNESKVVDLVRDAANAGKPIAANRGSVGVLAEAGILKGRRFAGASPVNVEEHPCYLGSTYTGTGTERDGLVSTNGICPLAARSLGLPDGTADLTQSLIDSLNEIS